MDNNNNNLYTSLSRVWLNGVHYQIFANKFNKVAFLVIDDDGNYKYPTIEQLRDVYSVYYDSCIDTGVKQIIDDNEINTKRSKPTKYKFIPKVLIGGTLVAISSAIIVNVTATVKKTNEVIDYYNNQDQNTSKTYDAPPNNYNRNETIPSRIPNYSELYGYDEYAKTYDEQKIEDLSTPTISDYSSDYGKEENDYLKYLALADDNYDYKWANDFYINDIARIINLRDSGAYEQVFGINKPTYKDLTKLIDDNREIDKKYKPYLKSFLKSWLEKFPDSDFTVLAYNLKTLKITEIKQADMKWAALSPNALACYRTQENEIFISEDSDIENKLSDRVIIYHEFMHACRTTKGVIKYNNEDYTVRVSSYDNIGLYYDEAVMTNLVYQVIAPEETSEFYIGSCNEFRIIQDCLGDTYTGSNYLNNSINYMAEAIDNYLGTEGYGLYILQLIDIQMKDHYSSYKSDEIDQDFKPLYDTLVDMYMKKYLKPGMTYDEANKVFDDFMAQMTNRFDELNQPYEDITEDAFRPEFEVCCKELNITSEYTR